MRSLVIAEHDNQALNSNTLHVLTAAMQVSTELSVLVAGYNCNSVVERVKAVATTAMLPLTVLVADQQQLQHFLAEDMVEVLRTISADFDYIFAPATTFGKNILPRLAAVLDVQQISDVVQIITADTFVRPIYAGNALETVQSSDSQKLITIRPTAFAALAVPGSTPAASSANVTFLKPLLNQPVLSTFVKLETVKTERPDLVAAKVVVSGGRGLQSAENFRLIEKLADKLHGAVGASRAAVDAGFIPNDHQVGQTGKVVAPELYIAIGISGAIQHLAGIKDSKVIIAINKDADAPIFQVADYGLVGDLFTIVPELIAALDTKK